MRYLTVMQFVLLQIIMVVLTFKLCDVKILNCDNSDERYLAVLSSGAVYFAAQGGSNF